MGFNSRGKIEHFQRRLEETIAWCSTHDWSANPAQGLRTASLRPTEQACVEQTFFHHNELWGKSYDEFWDNTPWQRQQVVERMAIQRAEALQTRNITPPQIVQPLAGGRLLAFDLGGTLSEGASYDATQGFFDGDNVPAWDTWIVYITDDPVSAPPWNPLDSYLLSWVPAPLVNTVEQGIAVTWEGCLRWARDLDSAFLQQLKQAGLML